MKVDIRLLGSFEVVVDGTAVPEDAWRRRQAAAVVKLLALAPGRRLHREQLVDAIWPDLAIDEAAPRLHKAAHYARKAMGSTQGIVLRHEAVALFPDAEVQVDATRFEALAQRARDGDPDAPAAALDLYRGPLLPADVYEPWSETPREHYAALAQELLRRAHRWEELLLVDPTDEDAHVALMRRHLASGDRRAALRQFERLDRALGRELGLTPGPDATALRDEILVSMPDLPDRPGGRAVPDLVGRDALLAEIEEAFRSVASGTGRTVLLSGPPGVGKSATVEHMCEHAARLGWRIGHGVAAAVEGAWPYAPVLEAFADLARRHPTLLDGLDDTYRAEMDRALAGAELTWTGDSDGPRAIAATDDRIGIPRPLGHQRLFVAAGELLRLAAAGTGLLLVIDDAHDADDASLRLLHYLARTSREARVLLVLAHRSTGLSPAFDEISTSLLSRHAAELELRPLDRDATRDLVLRHRPDATSEQVERIWAMSGGIPFTVTELARRGDDGEAGASTIGGLDAATRDVLQRVAIVGSAFDTDQFVALSGLPDDDAYAHLDLALAARVIERTGAGYRFRHALVRDALLADLPPHRQRRVHRDAAARLAEIDASPARVGHHLLEAGDHHAAVPYVLRAARHEAALGAYRDALELVETVRAHAKGDARADLLLLRGDLLLALGDPRAPAAYGEALDATSGAARRLVRAKLARAATFGGDFDTAAIALEGLEPDGGLADSAILLARGNYAFFTGDTDAAWEASQQARRLVVPGEQNWQLLDLVSLQGLIAHNRGEWFEQLRLELRRTRDVPEMATSIFDGHLCVAEYLLYGPTPYDEVIDLALSLRETARRAGALRGVAFAAALVGEAAFLAGDLERAEHELQDAVDLHREIGAAAGEAHSLQRLAEVRLAQGDAAEARRLLQRALPIARWSTIALHLIQRIYGTMIAAAPTPDDARAVVESVEQAIGTDDWCPFCQVMLEIPATIACADAGDPQAAHTHLARAEQSASLWHGTAWQAAMLEARAHLAAAEDDDARAVRLLAEAADTFDRAGQPLDASRCRAGLEAGVSG